MEKDLEQKIKDLKKFIELKTDLGVANYLGKELREICGMVETMTRECIEQYYLQQTSVRIVAE